MGRVIEMEGRKFGRFFVMSRARNNARGSAMWNCRCDCGVERVVLGASLRSGNTNSCGCLNREITSRVNTKHGLSNHVLYNRWESIVQRCTNPNDKKYKYYGGRGIVICDGWRNDFKAFYDWCLDNGYDEKLELDREDNDGNYEPSNCRFITHRKNSLNQGVREDNSSGYRGVGFVRGRDKWLSYLDIDGGRVFQKSFKTKQEAIEARNNYIKENNLEHEYTIQEWRVE